VQPKTMYHIGHSLTDRMADLLNNLVQAHTEEEISYSYKSIPGSPLFWHWRYQEDGEKGNMEGLPMDILGSGVFDVLSLTEATSIPSMLNDEERSSKVHANLFTDVFLDNATTANPEVYIYSTWYGRNKDGPDTAETIAEYLTQIESRQPLWEELAQSVKDEHPSTPVNIIPGGLVMAELQRRVLDGRLVLPGGLTYRETFFKQNRPERGGCDTRDHIHLSMEGIYAVALTHYATIFKSCPIGLPSTIPYRGYRDGCIDADEVVIDPDLALEIQRVVWSIVRDYPWTGVE